MYLMCFMYLTTKWSGKVDILTTAATQRNDWLKYKTNTNINTNLSKNENENTWWSGKYKYEFIYKQMKMKIHGGQAMLDIVTTAIPQRNDWGLSNKRFMGLGQKQEIFAERESCANSFLSRIFK